MAQFQSAPLPANLPPAIQGVDGVPPTHGAGHMLSEAEMIDELSYYNKYQKRRRADSGFSSISEELLMNQRLDMVKAAGAQAAGLPQPGTMGQILQELQGLRTDLQGLRTDLQGLCARQENDRRVRYNKLSYRHTSGTIRPLLVETPLAGQTVGQVPAFPGHQFPATWNILAGCTAARLTTFLSAYGLPTGGSLEQKKDALKDFLTGDVL